MALQVVRMGRDTPLGKVRRCGGQGQLLDAWADRHCDHVLGQMLAIAIALWGTISYASELSTASIPSLCIG